MHERDLKMEVSQSEDLRHLQATWVTHSQDIYRSKHERMREWEDHTELADLSRRSHGQKWEAASISARQHNQMNAFTLRPVSPLRTDTEAQSEQQAQYHVNLDQTIQS